MEIKSLDALTLEAFKTYCRKHRLGLDDSFLSDEDIDTFQVGKSNPTVLILNQNTIEGVYSLIQDAYQIKCQVARFRIFHCIHPDMSLYHALFKAMGPLNPEIHRLHYFVHKDQDQVKTFLENLNFKAERQTYVMVRKPQVLNEIQLPPDYYLSDYVAQQDDEDYLWVRNQAFKSIQGSDTEHGLEDLQAYMKPSKVIKQGVKILRYQNQAVGIIRMEPEIDAEETYAFVAPLAILPSFQGKGLGTQLLRAGIQAGIDAGFLSTMLSVNAENESALKLYKNEGFEITQAFVQYKYLINELNTSYK